jgi:hypothetical protein
VSCPAVAKQLPSLEYLARGKHAPNRSEKTCIARKARMGGVERTLTHEGTPRAEYSPERRKARVRPKHCIPQRRKVDKRDVDASLCMQGRDTVEDGLLERVARRVVGPAAVVVEN